MNISLYTASIPVFKQMLTSMSAVLAKAEAHATEKKIETEVFLQARLFPDMLPLMRQVHIATEFARGASARIAGVAVPAAENKEQTFAELQTLIRSSIAFLDSLTAAQMDGQEAREIVLRPGTPKERQLDAHAYLLSYALPQFFFHVTTAYAILRHNGVDIGKKDFMGAW